ncbi:MAG: class I SAM-dependent methyltransferase [Pseudomonadota bacterium]
MAKKPGLDAAYDLSGPASVRELYGAWAETYDQSFAKERGYTLHREVAEHFVRAGGGGPILDVGAGTGLVGVALAAQGAGPVDGTDISEEMLAVARAKGCYRRCFAGDVTGSLPMADNSYAGIISAGTFTLGHLGPQPLRELLRLTRPGGLLAITVNAEHWTAAGFAEEFDSIAPLIEALERAEVAIYAQDATHDHAADRGFIVTFRAR